MLRRLTQSTSFEILRMVYFACFYSRMSYCIISWGSSPHAIRIFKMQKKAIRILYRLNQTDSCRTYFSKTNTLTLPSLYVLKTLEYIKQNETNFIQRSMIHNHYT